MCNRIGRRETKSYSGKQYFNSELDKFSVVLLALLLAFELRFQDFELVLLILERFSVELCARKKEKKEKKINIKICKLMTGTPRESNL